MITDPPAADAPTPAAIPHRALALLLVLLAALALAIISATTRQSLPADRLTRRSLDWRVNPQHDDAATLQLLPGIGATLAQRIVEVRRHRSFHSINDLATVQGIGPSTARRVVPYLVFDHVPKSTTSDRP